MELKPIDLLNKGFRRKMRGYDASEVDEFLRAAAGAFEEALVESARLTERVESLETELQRYKEIESTLNNALVLAQKTADELKANAQKEAELIKREARDETERELRQAREELEEVRKRRDRFTVEFRALLRSYLETCESGEGAKGTD